MSEIIKNKNIHKLPAGTNESYFRLPNSIFEQNLSTDAFYLYAWLQSKPENWEIADARKLSKNITVMGRDRLYKAMTELEEALLLVRGKVRDKSGKIVKYIRELHCTPLPEKPDSGPLPGNPELVIDFGSSKKPTKTKALPVTNKSEPHPDLPDTVDQDIYKERENKERKERKEKLEKEKQVDQKKSPKKIGCRIHEDWEPYPKSFEWAFEKLGFNQNRLKDEAEKFKDYWLSKSGKDAVKVDWDATWRTWLRNSHKYEQQRNEDLRRADQRYNKRVNGGRISGKAIPGM